MRAHTEGANPRLGRSSTGLNLCGSARLWYMNVRPKIGSSPKSKFPFCFNFFQLKIRSKTVTTFNFEINQLIIVGFNSKLIIWFNKIVIALPLMPLFPKCHPCSLINKRLLRPSNTQKKIYFFLFYSLLHPKILCFIDSVLALFEVRWSAEVPVLTSTLLPLYLGRQTLLHL